MNTRMTSRWTIAGAAILAALALLPRSSASSSAESSLPPRDGVASLDTRTGSHIVDLHIYDYGLDTPASRRGDASGAVE